MIHFRPAIVLAAILVAVTASFLLAEETFSAPPNTIVTVDKMDNVGKYTSLALDGRGNPVVSYYDDHNGDLKVLHCSKPNCTGKSSITSPDTGAKSAHTPRWCWTAAATRWSATATPPIKT